MYAASPWSDFYCTFISPNPLSSFHYTITPPPHGVCHLNTELCLPWIFHQFFNQGSPLWGNISPLDQHRPPLPNSLIHRDIVPLPHGTRHHSPGLHWMRMNSQFFFAGVYPSRYISALFTRTILYSPLCHIESYSHHTRMIFTIPIFIYTCEFFWEVVGGWY